MSYMRRALSLARRALGSVSPNPSVGAVVVKDGEIVGEGWTQPPGQAHAEIVALKQAGERARGAVLYVTLEPCNHFGRTPPCTEAVIAAGVAEVHAAMIDPNPIVNGKGIARLNEAGIETRVGEGAEESRVVIEAYIKHKTTRLPFVTAKFAMSLDGKIATRTGDSKWITGDEARRYVHELRAISDAIMVGVNTVISDNPQLTARRENGEPLERQPLRVVVDSGGRTPPDSRMFGEPGKTLIAMTEGAATASLKRAGAEALVLPSRNGMVDVGALLEILGQREVASVFVEGGGTLLGSLFDLRLVDKVIAFVAPTIIGGRTAQSPVGGEGVEKMTDALRLSRVGTMQFGRDVAVTGYCNED